MIKILVKIQTNKLNLRLIFKKQIYLAKKVQYLNKNITFMGNYFNKVKQFLLDLNYSTSYVNAEDQVFVINKEESGIKNLVIACADPILIMEQRLIELNVEDKDIYLALLQQNRKIVHGAFVLDESGKSVIFRDTLQLENLDLNELEGSLNSLSLLLSEYGNQIISFSKK